MKNKIKLVFILFSLAMIYSCEKEDDRNVVDINNLVISFENKTENFVYAAELDPVFTTRAKITNIAPHNLTYTVQVNDSSTAIEGTEYKILNKTVTIESGYISGNVEVEILGAALAEGVVKTIILNLESADEMKLGANLRCEIDIRKVVIPELNVAFLAGNWSGKGNNVTISTTATSTIADIHNVWWGGETIQFEIAEIADPLKWKIRIADEQMLDCCYNATEWHIRSVNAYYDIVNDVIILKGQSYGFSGDKKDEISKLNFSYVRN